MQTTTINQTCSLHNTGLLSIFVSTTILLTNCGEQVRFELLQKNSISVFEQVGDSRDKSLGAGGSSEGSGIIGPVFSQLKPCGLHRARPPPTRYMSDLQRTNWPENAHFIVSSYYWTAELFKEIYAYLTKYGGIKNKLTAGNPEWGTYCLMSGTTTRTPRCIARDSLFKYGDYKCRWPAGQADGWARCAATWRGHGGQRRPRACWQRILAPPPARRRLNLNSKWIVLQNFLTLAFSG